MNHFSCFLFVMALCVGLGNAKLFAKNGLHFKNSLDPNDNVDISCKLNGEQMGGFVYLTPGQTYDFMFHAPFVPKNKIDCFITKKLGALSKANIRAFECGSGAFDHGKQNFWDLREDGIYFSHGKETPKLEYNWS
ncbi:hypothetical protein EUTSA_v10027181mg [Eutrema salsugineum]|uniref:Uncharacterized protein n=1 Tax=Eutrema salsugineum TaxID=72664 RepID=V4MKF3_EUTSA|nr:hypothetical protein EUTSA_v10027181mg [Eutrema salsugineum]